MLITLLLAINLLLALVLVFWLVNKTCLSCHQEMPPRRIFTFKTKCQTCEEVNHE